jgi:hypothetical protein
MKGSLFFINGAKKGKPYILPELVTEKELV